MSQARGFHGTRKNLRASGLTARIVSPRHAAEALRLAVWRRADARIPDVCTYVLPASEIFKFCYLPQVVPVVRSIPHHPIQTGGRERHASPREPAARLADHDERDQRGGGWYQENSADTRDASP